MKTKEIIYDSIKLTIALLFFALSFFIFLPTKDKANAISGDWYAYAASSCPQNITTAEELAYLLTKHAGGGITI